MIIKGREFPTQFIVSDNLRSNIILGDPWFRSERVIYDRSNDLVYFGARHLCTVFLREKPGTTLEQPELDTIPQNFSVEF